MTETVEGGAGIAWRLLATLEGGSLLLATSALLAYTARARVIRRRRRQWNIQRVFITNTTNPLGEELKRKLEARGCTVCTVTSDAGGGADIDIDVLLVVGSETKEHSLNRIAECVSEDVYNNLRLLESLSARLRRGGCIAWVCAGICSGAYRDAIAAFDTVLQASVQHVARNTQCEAIWIGRCESAQRAAERTIEELIPSSRSQTSDGFSLRNTAHKVSEYVGRWLKIIT